MPETVPLRVQLVAKTEFLPPADVPWSTDADGGQALGRVRRPGLLPVVEASRTRSPRPTPATCGTSSRSGHLSVLEHGTVTFYLTGVSRSLTHELIRHRHFSYSQLSQRYVPERDAAMVEPDVIADDPELHAMFMESRRGRGQGLRRAAGRAGERFADVAERHAAPQAGPAGGARRCCPTPPRPGSW